MTKIKGGACRWTVIPGRDRLSSGRPAGGGLTAAHRSEGSAPGQSLEPCRLLIPQPEYGLVLEKGAKKMRRGGGIQSAAAIFRDLAA